MKDVWRQLGRPATSIAGAVVIAWIIVKIGGAFMRVAVDHEAALDVSATMTWGLLLLASFAGFGSALNSLLFPRDRADWGLRCVWGWSVVVAIGGALCSVGLAVRGMLVLLVVVGLLLLFVDLARGYLVWSRRSPVRWLRVKAAGAPFSAAVAAAGALAFVKALGELIVVKHNGFNKNDDNICYYLFAHEILDRGTLSQPFSLRRIFAYGGKAVLDAFQLAVPLPASQVLMVDNGMALFTVMALVVGHVRQAKRTSRPIVLLLLLFILTLPEIRLNTATEMTGVAFFLGLYRTIAWPAFDRAPAMRGAVAVALLSAGICALRQNYLVPLAVLLVLVYGAPLVRAVRLRSLHLRGPALISAVGTAGLLVLFMIPWWAMSYRWVHSFAFPLVRGDFNPDYGMWLPKDRFEQLRFLWANVTYDLPVKTVPIFAAAALALASRGRRGILDYFMFAAFVGWLTLVKFFPDVRGPIDIARYHFGFTFAALLAVALAAANTGTRRPSAGGASVSRAALPLVVVAIGLQLYAGGKHTTEQYDMYLSIIGREYDRPLPWDPGMRHPAYALLQEAVPPSESIAVMVDDPYYFDLRRNVIHSLDMVGAVSPPPRLPLFDGPEAVASYLVSHGYRYAIVVHPDAAAELYRRDLWKKQQVEAAPIFKTTAIYYLTAFDVFDELRRTRLHLADAAGMTTLDLTLRPRPE